MARTKQDWDLLKEILNIALAPVWGDERKGGIQGRNKTLKCLRAGFSKERYTVSSVQQPCLGF